MQAVSNYVAALNASFGQAWNRFWFTPTRATTIGILRIAVGLLAFYAVATYAYDLERWFGPGGMLPVDIVRQMYEQWSLLDYVPSYALWPAYYASLALIALFTVGVGGRPIAILATLVTLSFFSRATLVTGEFESILSFLMVYLCIGNAGDEYSLPALQRGRAGGPAGSLTTTSSLQAAASLNAVSLRLIQVHIVIVHLMMAWGQLASPEASWWTGEGIWLAAMRPGMALADFSGLSVHPRVVAAWSHAITLDLLAFPVIVWPRISRPLAVALGAIIWLSIALATGWVPFCAAMIVGIASFLG